MNRLLRVLYIAAVITCAASAWALTTARDFSNADYAFLKATKIFGPPIGPNRFDVGNGYQMQMTYVLGQLSGISVDPSSGNSRPLSHDQFDKLLTAIAEIRPIGNLVRIRQGGISGPASVVTRMHEYTNATIAVAEPASCERGCTVDRFEISFINCIAGVIQWRQHYPDAVVNEYRVMIRGEEIAVAKGTYDLACVGCELELLTYGTAQPAELHKGCVASERKRSMMQEPGDRRGVF